MFKLDVIGSKMQHPCLIIIYLSYIGVVNACFLCHGYICLLACFHAYCNTCVKSSRFHIYFL